MFGRLGGTTCWFLAAARYCPARVGGEVFTLSALLPDSSVTSHFSPLSSTNHSHPMLGWLGSEASLGEAAVGHRQETLCLGVILPPWRKHTEVAAWPWGERKGAPVTAHLPPSAQVHA